MIDHLFFIMVVIKIDTFNIYYKRAYEASIEFTTIISGTYSEQRTAVQSKPRHRWILEFEKTPTSFTTVNDFFIAQKGRQKAFNWKWDKSRGGDDVTYTVRFDDDKLDFKNDEANYKTFTLPIIEVFDGE